MAPLSSLEAFHDSYLFSHSFLIATTIITGLVCSLTLLVSILMCCTAKKEKPQPPKNVRTSSDDDYDPPYYESAKSITMKSKSQQDDQRSFAPSQERTFKLQSYIADEENSKVITSFARGKSFANFQITLLQISLFVSVPGGVEAHKKEHSEKLPSLRLTSSKETYLFRSPDQSQSPSDDHQMHVRVKAPQQIPRSHQEYSYFSGTSPSANTTSYRSSYDSYRKKGISSYKGFSESPVVPFRTTETNPQSSSENRQITPQQNAENPSQPIKHSVRRVSIHPLISSFKETSSVRDRLDASTDAAISTEKFYSTQDWSTNPRFFKRPESSPQNIAVDSAVDLQKAASIPVQFQDGHNFEGY